MEIAPRVGSDDLEPLALRESGGGSVRQEREHALPVVLHSLLTSRWPAARPYAFPPIKKCCHWYYERSGKSEHQWYSSPRTSLGSQTWQNCWRHRLGRSSGRKYMLSQVDGSVWHSNLELWSHHVWSFQGYQRRWAPYSLACSHAHGSAKTHYKTFVCFKWGVFVKESGSYRPDYLHRNVCSEFPAAQTG